MIQNPQMEIRCESENILDIKITDSDRKRYEIPNYLNNLFNDMDPPTTAHNNMEYEIELA